MKKLFATVLAVVLVLAVASTAMAGFSWNPGSSGSAESFANRYKIEVVKLANETGIIGTNKMIEAPGATAVNNASVYFYIRLTVSGASADSPDDVQKNAKAKVTFTSLQGLREFEGSISNLANGVYYYCLAISSESSSSTGWKTLADFGNPNSTFGLAVIEARVLDTATAKVYAKVSSARDLGSNVEYGGYRITVTDGTVTFDNKKETTDAGYNAVVFTRESNGKVTKAVATGDANFADNLYTYLGFRAADVEGGKIYMSNDNLRAAFGFDYKGESSATWNAYTAPIIMDPPTVGVGIPKTGDNTSAIGFALVMLALVGAAVAVKKVNA